MLQRQQLASGLIDNDPHGELMNEIDVQIPLRPFLVRGTLALPDQPRGLVLFASGRAAHDRGVRDRAVARALASAGIGTFVPVLLTPGEQPFDERTRVSRFDLDLLAGRLIVATDAMRAWPGLEDTAIGYFAAGAGVAVALLAAAERPSAVRALVLQDGDPELTGPALATVAAAMLHADGHLREDAGWADFARLTCDWFVRSLPQPRQIHENA
jgi:putative phosphoribosyl transferase